MNDEFLTRQQCNAARALAIVGIMLHNYCHAFDFAIKESEFNFALNETKRWNDYLHHIDGNLFINIFSWIGPYILPIFMFLGGYGLVRKYEIGNTPFDAGKFIFKQYKKLFVLMIVPLLIFIAVQIITLKHTFVTPWAFIAQCAMVINFIPCLKIVPGPFWYLGMMMQLYVIYALIHQFNSSKSLLWIPLTLMFVGFALHLVIPEDSDAAGWLRFNSTVAFIPFAMGLLAARYGKPRWLTKFRAAILLPVLLTLIIAFSFDYVLWGLNYGLGAATMVCLVILIRGRLLSWCAKLGEVSALIYILHPLTRFIVLLFGQKFFPDRVHCQIVIYFLLTTATVFVYKKFKINEKLLKLIDKE